MKVRTYLQSRTTKVTSNRAARILMVTMEVDEKEGDFLQKKSGTKMVNR